MHSLPLSLINYTSRLTPGSERSQGIMLRILKAWSRGEKSPRKKKKSLRKVLRRPFFVLIDGIILHYVRNMFHWNMFLSPLSCSFC